jgi:TonB family protein
MDQATSLLARLGGFLLDRGVEAVVGTSIVLVGAVILDRLLARRVSAGVRAWLFLAVPLRLALPPGFVSPLGLRGGGAPSGPGVVVEDGVVLSTAAAAGADFGRWEVAAGAIYGLVALSLLLVWRRGRRRLERVALESRPADAWLRDLPGTVPVQVHPQQGPMVVGVLRPRIVLPAWLVGGEPGAVACVLAHERAHVERRDHWLAPLVQLACILAWPVVPLWIAARRLRTLVEMACDERATRGRGADERRAYAEALVAIAEGVPPVRGYALAPAFGADLRARILALRGGRRWRPAGQGAVAALALGVIIACSGERGEGHGQAPASAKPTRERGALTDPVVTAEVSGLAPRLGQRHLDNVGPGGSARQTTPAEGVDRGAPVRSPDVMPGSAHVRGSLDKDVIRTIIRRHINEVKYCYEQELAQAPRLAGRVDVEFTIDVDGHVTASALASSTMGNASVESCVVKAVRRWEFPPPVGGGIVIVKYPFSFSPSSSGASP